MAGAKAIILLPWRWLTYGKFGQSTIEGDWSEMNQDTNYCCLECDTIQSGT
jgi:hypothetical protein